jgi:hypothetical protein
MKACFKSRHLLVWLSALLVLFAALAPAISQAVSVARGVDAGLIPVCTHSGLKWMDAATGEVREAPGDTGLSGHMERCPFCLSQPTALPAGDHRVGADCLQTQHAQPFLFDHAPRTLFIWSRAQSRAPPAGS